MHIRQATTDDIDAIVQLNHLLFQEDGGTRDPYINVDWPPQEGALHFAGILTSSKGVILLAEEEDEVIGYLAGYVRQTSSLRPVAISELESMYVRQNFRWQGVGEALCTLFSEWSREQGAERLSVTAYATNDGALRFYERMGFSPFHITLEKGV